MFSRFDIYYVDLDPTIGGEIKKTRPCVIISPNEMNHNIATIIVAPITSKLRNYPSRVPFKVDGKQGQIVLDQIRTVDKIRLVKKIDTLNKNTQAKVFAVLKEMFAE